MIHRSAISSISLGPAILLAGAMCVLPFLQSRRLSPITPFYDEWLAIALGVLSVGYAAMRHRQVPIRIPVSAICMTLFALYMFLRAALATSAYSQSAELWGLYGLFAALMMILGQDLAERCERASICDLLAASLLAGAVANSIAGFMQIGGIPSHLDAFISRPQGTRAIGNVGQANLYANYLALGQASLLYLYSREKLTQAATVGLAVLLACAAALAASRASLLYGLLFGILGYFAYFSRNPAVRRLGCSALLMTVLVLSVQWLLPFSLNAAGFHTEALSREGSSLAWSPSLGDEAMGLRLAAWRMAGELFLTRPWIGVGPGEYAGAAFESGLPEVLSGSQMWTTPHNLLLQLLSETGLVGAAFVSAGILIWLARSGRDFMQSREPEMWWALACVGVELLHSMFEYPLSHAHFLAIAALIMGVGARSSAVAVTSRMRSAIAMAAVTASVILALQLNDYLKFDMASPVAAGRSLASDDDLSRDRANLAKLTNGLLAPQAERWLFRALPIDRMNLEKKIAIGYRVIRGWPSPDVVARQTVFFALDGRHSEAAALFRHGVSTYGTRFIRTVEILVPHHEIAILDPAGPQI